MKRVVFISSVGGHLTQLLTLKEIFNDYKYVLVTERNEVTIPLKEKYKMSFLIHTSRDKKIKYFLINVLNAFKSLYIFIKYRPQVIVTTGTHPAAPLCYLTRLFRGKVIFIESFAKRNSPTLSGKIIYPVATTFVVQWESMLQFYPKAEYWGAIY